MAAHPLGDNIQRGEVPAAQRASSTEKVCVEGVQDERPSQAKETRGLYRSLCLQGATALGGPEEEEEEDGRLQEEEPCASSRKPMS